MNEIEAKKIVSLYRNLSFLDRLHIKIRLRRLPFEIIEKYVPKEGKVLDFGCGHGFFSLYLFKKSKRRTILGVDISEEKIDIANASEHNDKISFKYSPESISFLEKKLCYNSIVIINVLYLLKREEQEEILKKASEALIGKGRLLIVEPDADLKIRTFYEIIRESVMLRLLRRTKGNSLTFNGKKWWLKMLKKYFSKVEYKNFANKKHHILYICSK